MRKYLFIGISLFLLILFSCTKIETVSQTNQSSPPSSLNSTQASSGCYSYPIIDSMPAFDINADSVEYLTILGNQRTNPYTLANMRQAYNNLGYSGVAVNATNQYVRFLPNFASQLSTLDSTLDAQGLEMFDAPMDYDVLQEGNYYQDPSIPDSSVTWQYAVVSTSFQFPAGITYQVLSQIHIPGDDYEAIETEAERLASIQDSINCSNGGMNQPQLGSSQIKPNCIGCGGGCSITGPTQVNGGDQPTYYLHNCGSELAYSWDLGGCGTTSEWTGNMIKVHWNSSGCTGAYLKALRQDGSVLASLFVTIVIPQPPPPPPPPAPDAQVPAGNITVTDINLNTMPGVRNVRIVAKRWFKIKRTYTDNNGHFQFTKHFKHKVKIVVKFKNSYCNIRGIRGLRIWQTLYPVAKTIGVYSGNKSNITYNFNWYSISTGQSGNLYWTAATTNNAIQEQRDYSVQFGFSAPPMGLNIYLTNWGITDGLSSTPLFGKRFISDLPSSFVNTMLVGAAVNRIPLIGQYLSFFAMVTRARLDMAIDYHRSNMSYFTSDFIKETVYHENSHASQYSQMGTGWFSNFVNAELAEIIANPSEQYNPYGTGSTSNSPIIAFGEAWGYHMGHFLADRRYGINASCQNEQLNGLTFCNYNYTFHPHIDVLEYFYPALLSDPFRWIPKGLMYDLIDIGEPPYTNVNDQVSGFTIQQIFAALQSDVTTIPQYKARILLQTNNNQVIQINNLFGSYGY